MSPCKKNKKIKSDNNHNGILVFVEFVYLFFLFKLYGILIDILSRRGIYLPTTVLVYYIMYEENVYSDIGSFTQAVSRQYQ